MSGSGLSLFRRRIGPLFVDDLSVTQQVAQVAPICAAYQVFDGIAGTSSGVLRFGMPSVSACSGAFRKHNAACCAEIDNNAQALMFQHAYRVEACASAIFKVAPVRCFWPNMTPAGSSHTA